MAGKSLWKKYVRETIDNRRESSQLAKKRAVPFIAVHTYCAIETTREKMVLDEQTKRGLDRFENLAIAFCNNGSVMRCWAVELASESRTPREPCAYIVPSDM